LKSSTRRPSSSDEVATNTSIELSAGNAARRAGQPIHGIGNALAIE
jgi:hypothetical protein